MGQDLRQQLRAEQAERARCTSLLSATQETLDALQADHIVDSARAGVSAESLEQADLPRGVLPKSAPRAHHELEADRAEVLAKEVSERTSQCEQLQEVIAQQTLKANETILELATRNLELERLLQEVTTRSLMRGTSLEHLEHDGAFSRASSPSRSGMWQRSSAILQRKFGCVGLRQLRRSASGPPRLNHSAHVRYGSWDPAVTLEVSCPSRSRRRSPKTSGLLGASVAEIASPNLLVGGETRSPIRRLCAPRGASSVGSQRGSASVCSPAHLVHVRKESRHDREGVPDWLFQGVDEIDEADAAAAAADAARARSGSRTSSPPSCKQRGNLRNVSSCTGLGRARG